MSTLRGIVALVRQQVLAAGQRRFALAAERRPALAAQGDFQTVLTAMGNESERAYPTREALTLALLEELRETGDNLWSSALLLAYYPMLSRLRFRLVSTTLNREELDQIVMTAFLAAVRDVPLRYDRLALRLRQRTEREVFAVLRKEWAEYKPPATPEEVAKLPVDSHESRGSRAASEVELSLLFQRAARRGVSTDGLLVIQHTVVQSEELQDYAARVSPDDHEERERTYQRLKRQRSRTLRRLKSLAGVSPNRAAEAL